MNSFESQTHLTSQCVRNVGGNTATQENRQNTTVYLLQPDFIKVSSDLI